MSLPEQITVVRLSEIPEEKKVISREQDKAMRLERSRVAKLAESIGLQWKDLNKVAKECIGREFGDVRKLSIQENRNLQKYLRKNQGELERRYRQLRWK